MCKFLAVVGAMIGILAVRAFANESLTPEQLKKQITTEQSNEKSDKSVAKQAPHRAADEALREPGLDSVEIPLRESAFPPFADRPATPGDVETRTHMMNLLWNTPLGQMVYFYLFDNKPRVEIPSLSRQLVRRMYGESSQVGTRISALHLLISDLYVRNKMTQDAMGRTMILEEDIYQENERGNSNTKNTAVYWAVMFFIFSLPFGSPVVRAEALSLFHKVTYWIKRLFGREVEGPDIRKNLKKIFSKEVFHGYEPGYAANVFFSTFGPYSMCYFFYVEWLTATLGHHVGDTTLLNGLDDLLKAMQL